MASVLFTQRPDGTFLAELRRPSVGLRKWNPLRAKDMLTPRPSTNLVPVGTDTRTPGFQREKRVGGVVVVRSSNT